VDDALFIYDEFCGQQSGILDYFLDRASVISQHKISGLREGSSTVLSGWTGCVR